MRSAFVGFVAIVVLASAACADTADEQLDSARKALKAGQVKEALAAADRAVSLDPKRAGAVFFRGTIYEMMQEHAKAIADFSQALVLDPRQAEPYNHRGSEQFKIGNIAESLADFRKYLELNPAGRKGHWRYGITCYYAGKYDDGRKQFDGDQEVFPNDVENAVWHFLCVAKLDGVDKARASFLKIGKDSRVPLMEAYALYAGKAKPADVLAAIPKGNPTAAQLNEREFYGHLYLGLYFDAVGDRKQALEQLTQAEKHKIGHYMWDVAHVHADRLRKGS
jgi:lipoprotein NlpI